MKKTYQKICNFFQNRSHWILLAPFLILFIIFIAIPVVIAILLSFTKFDTIQFPKFIGLNNYIDILTVDEIFMQKVLPNTFKYALFIGPGGYLLSFLLAWILAQFTKWPRTILAIIIYSPSMVGSTMISTVWKAIFSGDRRGYLNSILLKFNLIEEPIMWLMNPDYLMNIIILVSLWSSMGVGFLAMLSGILNVNTEIYEAAHLDGIKNRFQEVIYVTIPTIRPQMLFGAVMAVVNTFNSAGVGIQLTGTNPTPLYAGQLIVNHIEDYGFLRYEMGYASALSVVLLLIIAIMSKISYKLFADQD